MQWLDIYVQVPTWRGEAVSAYLQRLGSSGVVIHDETTLSPAGEERLDTSLQSLGWVVLYGALPVNASLPACVCALQQFLDTSPGRSPSLLWRLDCRPLQNLDYQTQWQDFFHPFHIGQRLVIHPPWNNPAISPEMEKIALDPGLAFGTGLHPTTHMCLTMLAQRIWPHQGGRCLDVGCGSGILSLAALKCGVAHAVGVDTDGQAIRVAARNAALNGLQDRVQFLEGSLQRVQGQFAVITANIYLEPLVHMMPSLARHLAPQGSVILSGILEQQEAGLRASLHAVGLEVRYRLAEEGWVALEGCWPSGQ